MKTLLIALMITTSISAAFSADQPKESELKLRGCLSLVYSNASNSRLPAKDVTKQVSAGVKECRQQISAIKKKEAAAKKLANKNKRIEKLKAQLLKLSSN